MLATSNSKCSDFLGVSASTTSVTHHNSIDGYDDDGDNKDHIEDEEDEDQDVAVVQTQSL